MEIGRLPRPRPGHAAQSGTDRNPARPAVADAVFAARQLRHQHGLATAAPHATSPAARPQHSGRPSWRGGALLDNYGRLAGDARKSPARDCRHRAHRRPASHCVTPAHATSPACANRSPVCRNCAPLARTASGLLLDRAYAELETPAETLDLLVAPLPQEPGAQVRDGGVIAPAST